MTFDDLKSPKTFLPGVRAKYVVVTPTCRKNRGDHNAAYVASREIESELLVLMENWPNEKGASFHLVLTVDRSGRGPS